MISYAERAIAGNMRRQNDLSRPARPTSSWRLEGGESPTITVPKISPPSHPPPHLRGQGSVICVVLWDHQGLTSEELDVDVGEELIFLQEVGEWIEAEARRPSGVRRGWLPANYVEKREPTQTFVVPPPASPPPMLSKKANSAPSLGRVRERKAAELICYEKRKDTMTKETFYIFMIHTEIPQQGIIYRRLSEFRALYVHLQERYPNRGLPELPVVKEGIFTIYSSLLQQLDAFFAALMMMPEDVVNCDLVMDFLRETNSDRTLKSTGDQITSTESLKDVLKADLASNTKLSASPPQQRWI